MSVYETLLEVQEHDSAADRLRHRRATLPELAALTALEQGLSALAATLSAAEEAAQAVGRRQRALEDELARVEAKVAELRTRLYSGSVVALRELQALQADVESLERRRSDLEDQVLEVMTEREPLDEEVARLEQERARMQAQGAQLREAVATAQSAIDAELAEVLAEREQAAGGVPADLLGRYDKLRGRLDGVGAARLVNGRCAGCHLALPATEVDRIKRLPPDALVVCEQCDRILVR